MMTVKLPRTGSRRILIVEDNSFIAMGMKSDLERLGHEVVGLAANADEARRAFRETGPDLLLMDIRLEEDDGLELTRQLLSERRCPVIIISAHSENDLIARAAEIGVFAYLVKPLTPDALKAQIAIAVRRFDESEQLRKEKQDLAQTLETRKLIERAKGILMKRMNLDEETAHRRLQLEAQKRRINIADCAKRVIESERLMGT
jgi:response regulator NasT